MYTKEQQIEVINLYKKFSLKEVVKIYKINKGTLLNILKKNGIVTRNRGQQRKWSLNESFFEKIDTQEKAYFLGLMFADGNNYPKRGLIQINLQECDKNILETFSSMIFNENRKLTFIKKQRESCKNQFCLRINSYKMSQDLINLGCVAAKSKILQFPTEEQVPKHLIHHFIRGYFDGDGSIWLRKQDNQLYFGFLGTENFISNIQNCIFEAGLPLNKIREVSTSIGTYRLTYGGNRSSKKLFDYLYNDATIFLDRKYNKFLRQ